MPERKIPFSPATPDSLPFWEATAEGRFLIRRCQTCDRAHWYPRPICPHCGGETVWQEASGRGTIYSYSIMRRAPEPYAIAYVRLEEGTTMMTNIVDCDFDTIRVGLPVRVTFRPSEGGPPMPMFMPDAG
ncbi:Zn-ribbon domain-containing OB-fold protein [Roseomonas sp. WA12]